MFLPLSAQRPASPRCNNPTVRVNATITGTGDVSLCSWLIIPSLYDSSHAISKSPPGTQGQRKAGTLLYSTSKDQKQSMLNQPPSVPTPAT